MNGRMCVLLVRKPSRCMGFSRFASAWRCVGCVICMVLCACTVEMSTVQDV